MVMNHIRSLRSLIITKQANAAVEKCTFASEVKKRSIGSKAGDSPKGTVIGKGLKSTGAIPAYPNWFCHLIEKRAALSELRRNNVETLIRDNLQRLLKLDDNLACKEILVPSNGTGLKGENNHQCLVNLGHQTQLKKNSPQKAITVPSNDKGLKGGVGPKIMLGSDYPHWLRELIKKLPALSQLRRKNIDTLVCNHLRRLAQHNNLAEMKEISPIEASLTPVRKSKVGKGIRSRK